MVKHASPGIVLGRRTYDSQRLLGSFASIDECGRGIHDTRFLIRRRSLRDNVRIIAVDLEHSLIKGRLIPPTHLSNACLSHPTLYKPLK